MVDRVSKTLPEPDACVSAEGEAGKGEHGVRDPVFAFRSTRGPALQTGYNFNKVPYQIPGIFVPSQGQRPPVGVSLSSSTA